MIPRFDDSLAMLATAIVENFSEQVLAESVVIRDAGGRLSVIVPVQLNDRKLSSMATILKKRLGSYARVDRVIADISGIGAADLLARRSECLPIKIDGKSVLLLDRRIVGADWLRSPFPSSTRVPRAVFASLKGGVGRSTALCVAAAHLSRRGRRVLAIDFDLEAPGIGTMLLRPTELPRFGTLDYLVENGISGIDEQFLADVSADSTLGSEGGRVTVIPAIGRATIEHPSNALAKIARAYLEDLTEGGAAKSLSDQLREMIERFEATRAYDVVLVDARAGLHESAAAAMLGIGAEILMFGSDHPQTYLGYKLLLAHIGQFASSTDDDWRDRFWFVHAKASELAEERASAVEHFNALYDLIAPPVVESFEAEPMTANDLDVDWKDEGAEPLLMEFERPSILHVLEDQRYRTFDPISNSKLLLSDTYSSSFKDILDFADSLIDWEENSIS